VHPEPEEETRTVAEMRQRKGCRRGATTTQARDGEEEDDGRRRGAVLGPSAAREAARERKRIRPGRGGGQPVGGLFCKSDSGTGGKPQSRD
jgi:hypothetical protein